MGPASRSIPTRPNSCRFASATYAFPAPTSMSTGSMPPSPNASAARACTPPRQTIWSAPELAIACSVAGWMPRPSRGGRAPHDPPHPCDPWHHDRHERRGHHRVAAARHVRAHGVDRAGAGDRAARPAASRRRGRGSSRSWRSAKARTCACANAMCSFRSSSRAASAAVDLGRADEERVGRPAVEPLGPVAHGRLAAPLDVAQDLATVRRISSPAGAGWRSARFR